MTTTNHHETAARFVHTTVDGVAYAIDVDGNVLGPDADGRPDALALGRVARVGDTREWTSDPGDGRIHASMSRREAVAHLARLAPPAPAVTDAEVEAAARAIAHAQEHAVSRWPKYAATARRALEAAAAVRR